MNEKGPDDVAMKTYSSASLYPKAYTDVVQESKAKREQYRDIVAFLPIPVEGQELLILEPGMGPSSKLKDAIVHQGLPVGSYKIFGIDKFRPMMDPRFPTVEGSATDLPFAANTFDAVILSSVLLYITNRERAVEECFRVLKPGGKLIMTELDVEITADILIKRVFAYEFKKTWEEIKNNDEIKGLAKFSHYASYMYKRISTVLPSIKIASAINKAAVQGSTGTEGFNKEQLIEYLDNAGFDDGTSIARTYADSYYLICATKQNLETES
ncbi:MAG: class I SAM-dependent methyltransferase [Candidatus Dojkabacteria bacterium]